MCFNFISVVIFIEMNISVNQSKVKIACKLPKRRGRKNGKEESRIIKEETFCRGERKLVLGDKNLKKIEEKLVSKKSRTDREGRTNEDLYARSAKTVLCVGEHCVVVGPFLSVSCFMLCTIKAQTNYFLILQQFAVKVQWVFQMDYSILLLKFVYLNTLCLFLLNRKGVVSREVCPDSGISDDV